MDAVGKLTGGIAHDFNNLLAAVLGGIGLIERRAELPDDLNKILAMTKRAAEQGSDLVHRLLVFARRQQLEPKPVDLASLHEGVDDLLTHTLGGLVELAWRIDPDVWSPFADQSQLELALMNLIINARDAMQSGGTITVLVENRTLGADDEVRLPNGDYVVVSVIDGGCGIPPNLIEKVLEPFFTTKEIGKGTGLGLSMVYGFAKQSGGTLMLHSEVDQGTRAELWLPRATEGTALAGDRQLDQQELFSQRSLRVLLIDDHPEVRGTTAAMLRDLGHDAVETSGGAEALDLLKGKDTAFDVLITDYAMPRQSGTEVVRLARQAHPNLPAVIVTGYADAEEIGGRPTDVGLLMKPFTLAELSGAVHRAFDGVTAP
jgi:CheY-like chemotaxis protein